MRPPMGQTGLILASGSPRRRELLAQLGIAFTVEPADLDEAPLTGERPDAYVARVAMDKARAVAAKRPGEWVLAADTSVVLGERILGKPRDAADARAMLKDLAGCTHRVITSVALAGRHEEAVQVSCEVELRAASDAELAWYVDTKEPMDKAGAYAIQGIGGFLVRAIRGSYSCVVGLPLVETLALLERARFPLPWSRR
jgi:septum formation protein